MPMCSCGTYIAGSPPCRGCQVKEIAAEITKKVYERAAKRKQGKGK